MKKTRLHLGRVDYSDYSVTRPNLFYLTGPLFYSRSMAVSLPGGEWRQIDSEETDYHLCSTRSGALPSCLLGFKSTMESSIVQYWKTAQQNIVNDDDGNVKTRQPVTTRFRRSGVQAFRHNLLALRAGCTFLLCRVVCCSTRQPIRNREQSNDQGSRSPEEDDNKEAATTIPTIWLSHHYTDYTDRQDGLYVQL
jgi:hypothetical protein